MKKAIGITLSVIGIIMAAINLVFKVNEQMSVAKSVSVIGGADGPTSIFIAGKIGGTPAIIGIIDIQQMKTLWAEIIEPQFNHEIFSCLSAFSFGHFLSLSESWSCDGFQYSISHKNDNALSFLSLGYGEVWKGNFEKSILLLERALCGFKKGVELNKQSGREISVDVQENYDTVQGVLSMIQRGDTKAQIIDKMQEIERIALNKAWGVMLSSEGNTIRLKKKELL